MKNEKDAENDIVDDNELEYKLPILKNSKVMITRNLWILRRLANSNINKFCFNASSYIDRYHWIF